MNEELRELELDRRLAGVKRDVPPPPDLWPSIAAQLEPRRRASRVPAAWRYALAAGLAAVAVSAVVAWQLGQRTVAPGGATIVASTPATPTTQPATAPATARPAATPLLAAAFEAPQDARYRATRAALEQTFRERLTLLAPETRTRIEQNLEIIRRANDDIRAALATDPNSPLLQQLLESTWQQEIDLYTTVSRNTEPALPRTAT
jgi:hypothetical protein